MCLQHGKANGCSHWRLSKKIKKGKKLLAKAPPFCCRIDKTTCHEFVSYCDADKWGINRYDTWGKSYKRVFALANARYNQKYLLLEEPIALYCGNKYRQINSFLRNPLSYSEVPIYPATMVSAILSAPTTDKKLIVYRQVPDDTIDALIQAHKSGNFYCEKGFMSVSLHKDTCINNCGNHLHILKIYMPKDISAVYVNVIAPRDEAELLLLPEMYLNLIALPYVDDSSSKIIYEVELIDMVKHSQKLYTG